MRISDWSSDVCSSDLAAAAILGAIEREISGADQHFRGSPVTRADRDADRGTDVERILIDLVGPRQRFDDGDREFLDAVGVAGFAHHDRELVAAEPAAHLIVSHTLAATFRNAAQHPGAAK